MSGTKMPPNLTDTMKVGDGQVPDKGYSGAANVKETKLPMKGKPRK